MAIGKMLPDQKSGFGIVPLLGLISARSNVITDWGEPVIPDFVSAAR